MSTTGENSRVLLLHVDGKLPNVALMRAAAHHRALGHSVELRRCGQTPQRDLGDDHDRVYASLIFEKSRPIGEAIRREWPEALIGGTGWDVGRRLEDVGIDTIRQDYSLYPSFRSSIGFLQRGCRMRCAFCLVPRKEGRVRPVQTANHLWRGPRYPRELLLLDNDVFGNPEWRDRFAEFRSGKFKVAFSQGINARALTVEAAKAIASVDYRDDGMKAKRIYTAWDNRKDERTLMRGLQRLVDAGVKPAHIMVYMLCGFWPGETHEDLEHRRVALRAFGAVPYPMPFVRTSELLGFQRWIVGAYDKTVPWAEWVSARYQPRNLDVRAEQRGLFG